jgi:hypothetical protein
MIPLVVLCALMHNAYEVASWTIRIMGPKSMIPMIRMVLATGRSMLGSAGGDAR